MILTLKIQVLMKMEKKHQESKNASEDDAVSEDANADGNATRSIILTLKIQMVMKI